MFVDITGLPKHAVVAALWNAARRQSSFDTRPAMSETRAREVARWLMQSKLPGDQLDWLDSRVMKVDIRGDQFDAFLYDRDNGGSGAAARVIAQLRQNLGVPEHGNQQKVSEVDGGSPQKVHGDCTCEGQCTCGCRQEVLPSGDASGDIPGGGEGSTGAQPS